MEELLKELMKEARKILMNLAWRAGMGEYR